LFLPPSSLSVDPDTDDVPETETDAETAGDTVEYDYYADDPSLLVEQPGKHPPSLITHISPKFYLLLALE
jgi:hypothetical protein